MKSRLSKKALGKVCVVTFRDHTENLPRPALAKAVGWLMSYDRREIHLCSWRYPREALEAGETHYRILRSTVEDLRFLGDTG